MVKYETAKEIFAQVKSDRREYLKWLAKETARREFEKYMQEQERLKQEQEHLKQEREQSILLMLSQGINSHIIAKVLNMTHQEIEDIENKYKGKNPLKGLLNGHS